MMLPTLNFSDAHVVQSNIGGQGPDGGPTILCLNNVGVLPNRLRFDLVISSDEDYRAEDSSMNGVHGAFGCVNVQAGCTTEIRFDALEQASGLPATLADFVLTFYEIETSEIGETRQTISVYEVDDFKVDGNSELATHHHQDGSIEVAGTLPSSGPPPSDPSKPLTEQQAKRAVSFHFKQHTGVAVTLGVGHGDGGRNFLFSCTFCCTVSDAL